MADNLGTGRIPLKLSQETKLSQNARAIAPSRKSACYPATARLLTGIGVVSNTKAK
ncbi:hypothetical protein QUA24_03435 [Microcoleus sp. Pol12B5]